VYATPKADDKIPYRHTAGVIQINCKKLTFKAISSSNIAGRGETISTQLAPAEQPSLITAENPMFRATCSPQSMKSRRANVQIEKLESYYDQVLARKKG